MVRTALARLYDIDKTITQLLKSIEGRSIHDISEDWVFGQACHYGLQMIGESANHLPNDLRERYPEVPWHRIIGLGHKLRHEYFRIDPEVIWNVLTVHLPSLHKNIKQMVEEHNTSTPLV